MTTTNLLIAIALCALVTWIPRVAPFIMTQYQGIPNSLRRFLTYLPLSIIFALTLSSLLIEDVGQLPSIKWLEAIAIIPTFYIAAKYKTILWAVLIGVLTIALLRLLF